jgi:hypothetical protein
MLFFRHGFEEGMPAWHWKEEDRRKLSARTCRCVVAYYDGHPYLNEVLMDLFSNLAGGKSLWFLVGDGSFEELGLAYPGGFSREGRVVECRLSDVAIAGDWATDGEFFQGLVVGDDGERVKRTFAGAAKYELHERAIGGLGEADVYVRRLFDDEHAWYSGEYEVLSTRLDVENVESVVHQVARRFGARVVPLEHMFTPKLLREDRLEVGA